MNVLSSSFPKRACVRAIAAQTCTNSYKQKNDRARKNRQVPRVHMQNVVI